MITQTVGKIRVQADGRNISWVSGLAVDADGSARAYAPANSGLTTIDVLANAGTPGNWYGLACNAHGVPYIQGSADPYPGHYVSETALVDKTKLPSDPNRYVNSERVPYIAIPRDLMRLGARLGDLAVVSYRGLHVGAICADVGPGGKLGEGSIALCLALGIDPFRGLPHHHLLGVDDSVAFRIMLGTESEPAWPRLLAEITDTGSFA